MCEEELSEQIIFTDNQFESLMCLCDAKQLLVYQPLPENFFMNRESEFAACFKAMLAATKEGVLFEDKRNEWVVEYILKNKNSFGSDIFQ